MILSKIDKESQFALQARDYPQDTCLERLKILKEAGYSKVTWKSSGSGFSGCDCPRFDGRTWTLDEFIADTDHDAAIFSKAHVGCSCSVIVEGDDLDAVQIWAIK